MGQVTPNMSIYIPAAGETNYDASFLAGMINIDQHDHSGPPDNGVPIATSGIADGSVTAAKLNPNVALSGGGLTTSGSTPNALQVAGVLSALYNLNTNGILVETGASTMSAVTITGTAGQIVVTNGNGVAGNPTISIDPAFLGANLKVVNQVFKGAGTYSYTPTSGMVCASMLVIAGGAAGGGVVSASGLAGTGGGAGQYNTGIFTAATIGASQSVVIGAGGTGVSANTGNNGGTSNVGTLITAGGGIGGPVSSVGPTLGGVGGSGGTGGDYNTTGGNGGYSLTVQKISGAGGASFLGIGASSLINTASNGNNAVNYGSGGSGACDVGTGTNRTGGNGADGIVVITEYVI
jgi:hypothetical protein